MQFTIFQRFYNSFFSSFNSNYKNCISFGTKSNEEMREWDFSTQLNSKLLIINLYLLQNKLYLTIDPLQMLTCVAFNFWNSYFVATFTFRVLGPTHLSSVSTSVPQISSRYKIFTVAGFLLVVSSSLCPCSSLRIVTDCRSQSLKIWLVDCSICSKRICKQDNEERDSNCTKSVIFWSLNAL